MAPPTPPPEKETKNDVDVKMEKPEHWKFTQWFRKMQNNTARQEEGEDSDHLTAVEFDDKGRFLATGDKSGNIVVLESDPSKSKNHVHYTFFGEFTSHFADFDFVKSVAIEEKINQIKFGPTSSDSLFLLTTNDKQIKLWKVKEKEQYKLVNWNIDPAATLDYTNVNVRPAQALDLRRAEPIIKQLKIPKKIVTEKAKMPNLKKMYASDVHQYNVTSLSVSADKESFISADSLRVNLWDMNISNRSYNVLDIKPDDFEELSEIISSIDCHPTNNNLFLYSTSLGNIMSCDLRQRALVDEPSQVFAESPEEGANDAENENQTFFNEMTQNVTDVKYSKGGKFIFSRDYMSVKIWDVAMERAPIETIYVHEYLREKLWDLYSQDFLWDPFGLGISSKGDIVTGTYSNYFHIFDLGKKKDTFIQASQQTLKTTDISRSKKMKNGQFGAPESISGESTKKKKNFGMGGLFAKRKPKQAESESSSIKPADDYPYNLKFESIEFNKKVLDCAWHPEAEAVAVAGQNNLYIYANVRK